MRTGPGDAVTEIVTAAAVTNPASISASIAADGDMTLLVNDAAAVAGKAPRLIPRQPAENFCLGHDDARPVTTYTGAEPFKGRIRHLKLTTP